MRPATDRRFARPEPPAPFNLLDTSAHAEQSQAEKRPATPWTLQAARKSSCIPVPTAPIHFIEKNEI